MAIKNDTTRSQTAKTSAAPEAPMRRKPGPRPGTEAAKRGGTAAREKYGREFYSRIGSKGGSTVRERHGSTFYTEIGRRGGESTKRNLGAEHYSRIGRIGGQRAHGRNNGASHPGEHNADGKAAS
jgi:general stress protein YciG